MKRSVLILLMSVLILLSACRSDPPVLNNTRHAEITVTGGTLDFTASADYSPGSAVLEITSPATVAGIRYTYTGGELHTACGGLDTVSRLDSLPSSAAPAILCEALSQLDGAVFAADEDGRDIFHLKLRAGTATITAEDGALVSLTTDFSPCVIAFGTGS